MKRPDQDQTRAWLSDLVRSGMLSPDELYAEACRVIAADHPDLDAADAAASWIAAAEADWRSDAESWPEITDFDRLQKAFTHLAGRGVLVLQGCADHWAAHDALRAVSAPGALWFTPPDIWHALDQGMLEVNLWHGDTANAAPGDELLDLVLGVLAEAGLSAHFDEGRIEVSAYWHRRPGVSLDR